MRVISPWMRLKAKIWRLCYNRGWKVTVCCLRFGIHQKAEIDSWFWRRAFSYEWSNPICMNLIQYIISISYSPKSCLTKLTLYLSIFWRAEWSYESVQQESVESRGKVRKVINLQQSPLAIPWAHRTQRRRSSSCVACDARPANHHCPSAIKTYNHTNKLESIKP